MKITGVSVGLGLSFFVVFWLTLDSLALGIAMGVAMGAAFSAIPMSEKKEDEKTE